jgi:hypothetical protein
MLSFWQLETARGACTNDRPCVSLSASLFHLPSFFLPLTTSNPISTKDIPKQLLTRNMSEIEQEQEQQVPMGEAVSPKDGWLLVSSET